eukprot:Skav236154  [mRNA]  locus=scaffold436:131548:131787:- [translate_table: standard]
MATSSVPDASMQAKKPVHEMKTGEAPQDALMGSDPHEMATAKKHDVGLMANPCEPSASGKPPVVGEAELEKARGDEGCR